MSNTPSTKVLWGALILVFGIAIALAFYSWQLRSELQSAEQKIAEQGRPFPLLTDPWLSKSDPFDAFTDMRSRIDDMMESFSNDKFFNSPSFDLFAFDVPEISMDESKTAYVITMDVPKGQAVEINTKLEDQRLSLTGVVKDSKSNARGQQSIVSSSVRQFTRSFYFPLAVDEAAMTVEQSDDNITITVPKS